MYINISENKREDYINGLINDMNLFIINDTNRLGTITASLNSLFRTDTNNVTFDFHIVDTQDDTQPFFGVKVFPKVEAIIDLMKDVVINRYNITEFTNRFTSIDTWFIELDSKLITPGDNCYFTGREVLALILHEINRMVTPSAAPLAIFSAYRDSIEKLPLPDLIALKPIASAYAIPVSIGCSAKVWYNAENEIIMYSDLLKEFGLVGDLVSMLDKIYRNYGTIYQSNIEVNDKLYTEFMWCNKMVNDSFVRTNNLKDDLYYKANIESSLYMKTLFAFLLDLFQIRMRERYTGRLTECVTMSKEDIHLYKIVMLPQTELRLKEPVYVSSSAVESIFKKKPQKLPSQFDIDRLFIELDKITNHHDRLFVLDQIYEIVDAIEAFKNTESYISNPSRYDRQINSMEKEISKLRKLCLEKKLNKTHKFFVKYPEGYEG